MHLDRSSKTKDLLTALGHLGQAQERGADEHVISELTERVEDAKEELSRFLSKSA